MCTSDAGWYRRAAAGFLLLAVTAATARAADPPRILVIYAETTQLPSTRLIDESFRAALRAHLPVAPRIYEEYLDARRFPGLADDAELARWWTHKYRNDRPDLIVSVTSLPFTLLRHGAEPLWSDVPIVFNAIGDDELKAIGRPSNSTGVVHQWYVRETADLIGRLLPGVRRIVAPYGTSQFDAGYREIVRAGMRDVRGLAYEEWNDLTLGQMRDRLRDAPDDAAVYVLALSGDRETPSLTPSETVQALTEASRRPVFGGFRTLIGTGVAGGVMIDPYQVGDRTGQLAARVLSGERADAIPIVMAPSRPVFDARQLRRFGIARSALPANAEVLYDDVPVFEQYRWHILGAAGVVLLQAAMIAVLLEQRRRRVRAESANASTASLNEALVAALANRAAIVEPDGAVSWLREGGNAELPSWLQDPEDGNILHALAARAARIPDAGRLHDAITAILNREATDASTECRFTEPPGGRWFEVKVRPLQARDGAAVTFHDIGARKQLEAEQRTHMQQMAHLDRVASLGALATSLAHELKQPLTAILTNAQAAQVLLDQGNAPDELSEALSDIVDDDRRASDIIQGMRRLLKNGDVEAGPVDLNVLCRDAVRLVAGRAADTRVSLEASLSTSPAIVQGDAVQLQQVIVNILLNAIDATAARDDGPRRVFVETRQSGDEVRVSVHDAGRGVDPDVLPQIFRPFYSTKTDGLGMGLSISRTIVEAHRGRIAVENSATGAVVMFTLPAHDSEGSGARDHDQGRIPGAGRRDV